MTKRRHGNALFGGAVLILLGAWFLFDGLGFDLPRLGALWPAFPLLSGALSLFAFATREKKDPSLVFSGISGVLLGLFFFCFTLDFFDWDDLGELWPVFPLIIGCSFLGSWLAGRCREKGLIVPGVGATAVGAVGLLFTLNQMSFEGLRPVGSLAIVAVGAVIVVRSLRA
jgi:hypothetical protein